MSDESKQKTSTVVVVVGLCAAIGFGAIYAMVAGGDNRSTPNSPQELSGKTVQPARDELKNSAAVTPTAASGQAKPAVAAKLSGADGKPLNRGAMTTFVFKKQVMAPEKQPVFNGPDGKAMTLANLKGKVVLLNLWATWCAPCRKEMPFLNTLQKELGSDQFEVLALSVDRGSPEKSRKFLADVGATSLRFFHDPTAQAGFSLMAIGMPTTLLFDRQGRELGRLVGPAEWHSKEAKDLIKAAIAAG